MHALLAACGLSIATMIKISMIIPSSSMSVECNKNGGGGGGGGDNNCSEFSL